MCSKSSASQTELQNNQLQELLEENKRLKNMLTEEESLGRSLFLNKVFKSDANVLRYTGISTKAQFDSIYALLDEKKELLNSWRGRSTANNLTYGGNRKKPGPKRKLTGKEEFTLTMVRLRTGMLVSVLADLFGISSTRVSQVFATWINFLHQCFKPLIKWPSKSKVKKHMPASFKKEYPNTRAIIDCTEFFIQKPSNTKAQSTTYSSYKSHNTAKVLVAISPTGGFTFVSEPWGGNASDRFLTKHSGFLKLVEEGDDIMADRGFNIRDLLLDRKATLNIPPFTRKTSLGNKKKLNVAEIKQTRKIAKLRIHVERAIERMKNFTMLSNTIPLACNALLTQMIVVAAFMCNLLAHLVK